MWIHNLVVTHHAIKRRFFYNQCPVTISFELKEVNSSGLVCSIHQGIIYSSCAVVAVADPETLLGEEGGGHTKVYLLRGNIVDLVSMKQFASHYLPLGSIVPPPPPSGSANAGRGLARNIVTAASRSMFQKKFAFTFEHMLVKSRSFFKGYFATNSKTHQWYSGRGINSIFSTAFSWITFICLRATFRNIHFLILQSFMYNRSTMEAWSIYCISSSLSVPTVRICSITRFMFRKILNTIFRLNSALENFYYLE